jgi:hypothetical protein
LSAIQPTNFKSALEYRYYAGALPLIANCTASVNKDGMVLGKYSDAEQMLDSANVEVLNSNHIFNVVFALGHGS